MFEIHPSAADNFNKKALLLVDSIVPDETFENKKNKVMSDIHISAEITNKDIIGTPKMSVTDYKGRIVGRYFMKEGKRFGLIGDGYNEMVTLVEAVQKLPAFRDRIGKKFLEEFMFNFLEMKFRNNGDVRDFIPLLVAEASRVVKTHKVIVPIAYTSVEVGFEICGATIRNLTRSEIDELFSKVKKSLNVDAQKSYNEYVEKFKKDFQGYAVVEVELLCESDYANDLSMEVSSKITDLLGIYSPAMLVPDVKCISKIKGTEGIERFTTVIKDENGGLKIREGLIDPSSAARRYISKNELMQCIDCGLTVISDVIKKQTHTDFEKTILNMTFLYAKAAFTLDPLEKLVHMLSALESTLLKNDNEPIQQNLAERIAIFTSSELNKRKEIIKNIKCVYGLRSRYLHHGHTSNELDELSKFFSQVWVFYVQLVKNSDTFKTKDEFINAIEDHKLS